MLDAYDLSRCRLQRGFEASSQEMGVISQVIEVPSPLGLRPSGLEDAPDALRRAGLHERLGSPDALRIDVPPYDDVRDPETGVLNPQGITAVAREVACAVDATLDAGHFPVLLGGDCSIILGPLLALRRRGRYGLAFLDGHADFQHPGDEPNGEVASLDLAVATGRGPDLLTDLDGLRPLVRDQDVALVGYRVLTITTISSASISGAQPSRSLTFPSSARRAPAVLLRRRWPRSPALTLNDSGCI